MALLAFDAAGNACSAAVWCRNKIVAHVSEELERGKAERLAPMLKSVMDRAALAFSQLEIIAVTVDPVLLPVFALVSPWQKFGPRDGTPAIWRDHI